MDWELVVGGVVVVFVVVVVVFDFGPFEVNVLAELVESENAALHPSIDGAFRHTQAEGYFCFVEVMLWGIPVFRTWLHNCTFTFALVTFSQGLSSPAAKLIYTLFLKKRFGFLWREKCVGQDRTQTDSD